MPSKYLIFLIIPIILAGTKPKYAKNVDFTIVSTSKQIIHGGVYGSPIVSNYTIKVKAIRAFLFFADTAFAEGRKDKITILNDSNQIVKKCYLKKNKTYTIYFSIVTPTSTNSNFPDNNFTGSPESDCKIKSPLQIVLMYKGGKSKYLIPLKINNTNTVYAP